MLYGSGPDNPAWGASNPTSMETFEPWGTPQPLTLEKKMKFFLGLFMLLPHMVFAHTPAQTYATRPPCDAAADGNVFEITDPLNSADCGTGGGTAEPHHCTCDGGSSTWFSSIDILEKATVDIGIASTSVDFGLGTASPGSRLHVLAAGTAVVGDTGTVGIFQNIGTGKGATVAIMGTANSQINFGDVGTQTAGRIAYDHGTDKMRFFTDETEQMVLTSAGDLGIGTVSPTAPLDITRATSADTTMIELTNNNGVKLKLENTSAGKVWFLGQNVTNGGFYIEEDGSGGVVFKIKIDNSVTMGLDAVGNGDFFLDSLGNLGLKCLAPDHDLNIGGTGSGCNTGTWSELDAGESSFTVSSHADAKKNVRRFIHPDILRAIRAVPVMEFDYKDVDVLDENGVPTGHIIIGKKNVLGLMAEDWEPVFGRGDRDESNQAISVNYHEVMLALYMAAMETSFIIDSQQVLIDDLTARVAVLENR